MSGVEFSEEKLLGVWSHSFNDSNFLDLLKAYKIFLKKFLSDDHGTLMVLHKGGLDSFAMSASDVINKVKVHHPALKLLNSLVASQISSYSCYGFYVGVLCLSLLIEMLQLEDSFDLPKRIVKDVSYELITDVINSFESNADSLTRKLNIGNLKEMMTYVGRFINQKNLVLSSNETEHLKYQLVLAFLQSMDLENEQLFGEIIIKVIEGRPASEACVIKGILLKDNQICSTSSKTLNSSIFSQNNESNYKTALFTFPLAFEKSNAEKIQCSFNISNKEMFNGIIIKRLLLLVKEHKIKLIACQKFIDEEIIYELEKVDVIVFERLGTNQANAFKNLSHSKDISDINLLFTFECYPNLTNFFGKVTGLDKVEVGGASYLKIINDSHPEVKTVLPVVTLVVPVLISSVEDNVEAILRNALKNLRHLALHPTVCVGGGCFESILLQRIYQFKPDCRQLDVTDAQYKLVRNALCKVFADMAVILSGGNKLDVHLHSSGHIVNTDCDVKKSSSLATECCCGCVKLEEDQNLVPILNVTQDISLVASLNCKEISKTVEFSNFSDLYIAKVNAIKSAFQCFSQLYDINYCIYDK